MSKKQNHHIAFASPHINSQDQISRHPKDLQINLKKMPISRETLTLIRGALHEISEQNEAWAEDTWADFFPLHPLPDLDAESSTTASDLFMTHDPHNRWRDADGSIYTCREAHESSWILHEWIFALICFILDGKPSHHIRESDVVREIRHNRRKNETFAEWRDVNGGWIDGYDSDGYEVDLEDVEKLCVRARGRHGNS